MTSGRAIGVNKLWAPWRKKFLTHPKPKNCIFCSKPKSRQDRKNLILERGEKVFTILNLYPYNNGHLMIAPYRHVASPDELEKAEWDELFFYLRRCQAALRDKLKPEGYNMGMNVGKSAGAGFDGHIHFHIVPRWVGDTNFMPVVAGEKVISESLDALHSHLMKALRSIR